MAQFFKKFSDVWISLADYRIELMDETRATGIPPTRSLMLELDDSSLDINDQFMLGSKYLMAPIFSKGSTSRSVYFPPGFKW